MPLNRGARLGPYEVIEPLGSGGMGQVYRAIDSRLNRPVALKVIADRLRGDPQLRERFKTEAALVAALNHPHICRLYDVGAEGGIDFLVMELLDGETLAARLERGRLPVEQAIRTARETAEALDVAHRRGIIHRDLKPQNVMLTRDGVKLLDFGVARLQASARAVTQPAPTIAASHLTDPGARIGTWSYMAPEQVQGREADARSDVFALGAMIYEMLTGRRAFDGSTHQELIGAVLEREPPPISGIDSAIPAALERIVSTCLAKNPDNRWQSCGDVARALDVLSPPAPAVAASRRGRLWPWLVAASAVLSAVAMASIAVDRFQRTRAADRVLRTSVLIGAGEQVTPGAGAVAMSPDGSTIVYEIVNEACGSSIEDR